MVISVHSGSDDYFDDDFITHEIQDEEKLPTIVRAIGEHVNIDQCKQLMYANLKKHLCSLINHSSYV
jgi:hypothetical protein